jgi:AcrR family transcriptional regulator
VRAKPGRRARGSLSVDEIINAATALIERDGLEGLSMPSLAKNLNAGVMSIYWYFHSKDDLLVALADRAFLDVYSRLPPVTGGSWSSETVVLATALHRELRKASLYLHLCRARPRCLILRSSVIPALARRLEEELRLFARVAMSMADATRFLAVLSAYTRGFALMQIDAEVQRQPTGEDAFEGALNQLPPGLYPTLEAAGHVAGVISVTDDSFHTCLRLLVAGMESEFERLSAESGTSSNDALDT